MRTIRIWTPLAMVVGVLALSGPAIAGSAVTSAVSTSTAASSVLDPATQQKLDELDQKVKVLERLREIDAEAAEKKKLEGTSVTASAKDGFQIKSNDGSYSLKVGGYVQGDFRGFFDDKETKLPTTFLVRRARPVIEGTAFKIFDFRLMTDFGGGTATVQDAYAEARFFPELKVRIGKFKPPVGLERLQSGSALIFVERALPTNLVPNRDVGVQIGGDPWDGALSYQLGVFNGVPDLASGDVDTFDDKDFAARIFAQPFKANEGTLLAGLGFGVAGSFGSQHSTPASPALAQYRTGGQNVFFRYRTDASATVAATEAGTARADGDRTRISPQAYWYWDSLGLVAEYVISEQEVKKSDVKKNIQNDAYQITVSYVLTNDKASFRGVNPTQPFQIGGEGWGAVELKARWNELSIDDAAFPDFADLAKSAKKASAWGIGANWYLTKNYKLNLDYEQTSFDGGKKDGDRETENAVLSRVQISF